jgi:membrane peptidoglycan carboxypeptidase
MHPVLQRRRHRLMVRRTTSRRGKRQGVVTLLLAILVLFVVTIGGSVVGSAGAALAAYNYFAAGLPAPNILDGINLPQSTLVYDRTGKTLLARFECQNREYISFADIPSIMVNATVATEDKTFWTNSGVDFAGALRALVANLRAGTIVQGASTITQQVIKYAGSIKEAQANATPAPTASDGTSATATTDICKPPDLTFLSGRTFPEKIKENILALEVTNAYPGLAGKEKILEAYLNLIFYGNGSYGIKAAAANYFGITDLSKLTLAQAAFLAGIPQLPSVYDPYQNPAGAAPAMARRDLVLGLMLEQGYITQAEYQQARSTTWDEMHPSRVTTVLKEPLFTFRVENEAEQILSKLGVPNPAQAVRTGGYRIITTLDYGLQQVAKADVKKWVASLKGNNVNNAALVALDSRTGAIVAYVGSVDYNNTTPAVQGQFDVAGLGMRQIGSAFKPFAYTSAFQARKASPATLLIDTGTDFGGGYSPQNADELNHGPLLAMDALRYSLNIPSVQVQALATPDVTARFVQAAGIADAGYVMNQHPGLTLTLGSVPVNLTQATQGYEMFAAQGTVHPATTISEIRDRNGRLVYSLDTDGPTALHPATPAETYLTHWILEGNTNPATNVWWGRIAQLLTPSGQRREAGVKTGTTNDYRDVTTFGYVPGGLVTGVWMGNNNQVPMTNNLLAAYGPLRLWQDFMTTALNKPLDWDNRQPFPVTHFTQPAGVTMATVCRWDGLSATQACGPTIQAPFLDGTVPPTDTYYVNGCLDIVKYVTDQGRPASWVLAAQILADRLVNGDYRVTPALLKSLPKGAPHQWGLSPVPGTSGFPPVCGQKRATPTPSESPGGSGFPFPSGPFATPCHDNGNKCTPPPPPTALAPASGGTPDVPLAIFATPVLAGLFAYGGKGWRAIRRRRVRG